MDTLADDLRRYGIRHKRGTDAIYCGSAMLKPLASGGVSATVVAAGTSDLIDMTFSDSLQAAKYLRKLCLLTDCWKKVHAGALYCRYHILKCESCGESAGEFALNCPYCRDAMFCTIACALRDHNCGAASSL